MWKKRIWNTSSIVVPLALLASGCGGADDSTAPTTTGASGGTAGSTGTAGSGGTGGSGGAAITSSGGGGSSGGSGGTAGSAGTGGAGGGNPDAADAPDARDCGPTGALVRPTVPAAIEAPAAATLVARFHAYGVQIYTCTAGNPDAGADAAASYTWTFKAPEATLEDGTCAVMGTHFAGPTWKSSDGSSVVGSRAGSAPSSNANSIPQLLLQAVGTAGEGILANVTFIQRLDTNAGNAPADGCSAATAGSETRASYTATYYFYTGGATADGGADASPDAPAE